MVALNEIQELIRRIADEFHPEKIILFGSCATALRAVPTPEVLEGPNDVDFLFIMQVRTSTRPVRAGPGASQKQRVFVHLREDHSMTFGIADHPRFEGHVL